MPYTLIANTGIHLTTFPFEINVKEKFGLWFREWYNTTEGEWVLDLLTEVTTETNRYLYKKKELFDNGYLKEATGEGDIDVSLLAEDGIDPLMDGDEQRCSGEIYKMTFADKNNTLAAFENRWLPLPYFFKRSATKFDFGPLNWSRFMLVPTASATAEGVRRYNVVLAFDTRTAAAADRYSECPVFPDNFATEMKFEACSHEYRLMDFCSPGEHHNYINDYLFSLVHPELSSIGKIKTGKKLSYVASYYLLADYIAQRGLFPDVSLYRDEGVLTKDVDMVVDIGNSRTTALLVEDNATFNQVNRLWLTDYTNILRPSADGTAEIGGSSDPFDMRLAFRRVSFGDFGIEGSRQFVYPSFVRLGKEANCLIHRASEGDEHETRLSTMSSPKRYLWDGGRNREEWKFMVLEGETDHHILNIPGISEMLRSDGRLDPDGGGGQSYHYSKRSLMTFAFLEMLTQARTQINSDRYRTDRGDRYMPRRVRRLIVTCPTAMSKVEREALVRCAADAVKLLNHFTGRNLTVDIVPAAPSFKDTECRWYYDEATCAQLVYVYGEVGYKYKGCCREFFNIYGHCADGGGKPELVIGSLDIGAGTSDLMISRYTYRDGDVTTILPEPLFYDSFYYAGDDMLNELIRSVMFFSPTSALRSRMEGLTDTAYRQRLRDFFGPDHSGQTQRERILRRDFNLQYSVPLMHRMLELLADGTKTAKVRLSDIADEFPPSRSVADGFKAFFGFDLSDLEWDFDAEAVSAVIAKAFEPLLKKIATIMYAHGCDIVLLSGRPASLSPIRDIFLKYYSVSPNRLILLNNYFVGHWYPFGHNTGHITNPKTIVAMGALVGHYATSLANLDRFVIDKSLLDSRLASVINYVEAPRDSNTTDYFITPERPAGELIVTTMPTTLRVRQLGIPSYPSRALYIVDFNRHKLGERIRQKALAEGVMLSDNEVMARLKQLTDSLRARMPFYLSVERDEDDKEHLLITAIRDRNDADVADNCIEINIQSLGAGERYWLDTGIFEIQ